CCILVFFYSHSFLFYFLFSLSASFFFSFFFFMLPRPPISTLFPYTTLFRSYIDVAGAGGTSWSQVAKLRSQDPLRKAAAEAFNNWGIPTKDCIVSVRSRLDNVPIVASGGMKTGLDAAKAITIGADVIGYARKLLESATQTADAVIETMEQIELELKMAMFGIGVQSIDALKQTDRVNIMGTSLLGKK